MNPYQDLVSRNEVDVADSVEEMIRERRNDVKDFDNLQSRFILGRKVGRIPTGATNVISGDKVGDFNIAEDSGTVYLYALVDLSGGAEWRRVSLSSW